MVKQKIEDVKKELDEIDEEVYGDATESGSNPGVSGDEVAPTVDEMVGDAMGKDAEEEVEDHTFDLEEEIEEDEEARRSKKELHLEDEE